MPYPLIDYDPSLLKPGDVERNYDRLQATIKHLWPHFTDDEVVGIIALVNDICPHCHNGEYGHAACNDE
jgi:hypothetical protein